MQSNIVDEIEMTPEEVRISSNQFLEMIYPPLEQS